jgi:hypothetical protein
MNEDHTTVLRQTIAERKEYELPLGDTIQARFEAFDKANPRFGNSTRSMPSSCTLRGRGSITESPPSPSASAGMLR